jgi:hypothetical protein
MTDTRLSREDLKTIEDAVMKSAQDLSRDAAYGGRWDDGGADAMRDQFNTWKQGYLGKVLPEYAKILKDAKREADPEYAEFLRLKKRFGE